MLAPFEAGLFSDRKKALSWHAATSPNSSADRPNEPISRVTRPSIPLGQSQISPATFNLAESTKVDEKFEQKEEGEEEDRIRRKRLKKHFHREILVATYSSFNQLAIVL